MNWFFFGRSEQPLFGAYHPAHTPSRKGVVLCNPWGQEYVLSHHAYRSLAGRLAKAGVHVLRFDYFGTGDSSGDSTEGHVDQWLTDIAVAVAELKDTADIEYVTLLGLRLGASLAALAVRDRTDVNGLVLWDPVSDGSSYLREVTWGEDLTSERRTIEAGGFPITSKMIAGLRGISLDAFPTTLPPGLLVSNPDLSNSTKKFEQLFVGANAPCDRRIIPSPKVWEDHGAYGSIGLPVDTLSAITDWVVTR